VCAHFGVEITVNVVFAMGVDGLLTTTWEGVAKDGEKKLASEGNGTEIWNETR